MMTLSKQSPVARDRAGLRSMARQLLAAVFLLSAAAARASAPPDAPPVYFDWFE